MRRALGRAGGRGAALLLAATAPFAPAVAAAADPFELAADLMSEDRRERRAAGEALAERGGTDMVAPLVDALFFTPRERRRELLDTLEALTGESHDSHRDWVEAVGASEGWTPHDGYLEWKASLLSRIDERYPAILYPGAPSRIRLEEVVWGGVPIDGIPPLDYPPTVPAAEAGYLKPRERVFGVELDGRARAYPLRFLDWHEMLNDRLGDRPFVLSYCTLCGSGILYATDTPSGDPYTFGTSGLLYRSNKLMFDRQTLSLWSNLTGRPVVGRLGRSPVELEVLPMTLTTWEAWSAAHPGTDVVDLEAVRDLVRGRYAFDYRPGAADRARAGVSFPVWLEDDRLDEDEEVYTLRVDGRPKAWVVDRLLEERVVNDELAGVALVLVGDPESGAVRAYARGSRTFAPGPDADVLLDEAGNRWTVEEHALRPARGAASEGEGEGEGAGAAPAAEPLERLPGHVAYWFGWFGFYPQTELYGVEGAGVESRQRATE